MNKNFFILFLIIFSIFLYSGLDEKNKFYSKQSKAIKAKYDVINSYIQQELYRCLLSDDKRIFPRNYRFIKNKKCGYDATADPCVGLLLTEKKLGSGEYLNSILCAFLGEDEVADSKTKLIQYLNEHTKFYVKISDTFNPTAEQIGTIVIVPEPDLNGYTISTRLGHKKNAYISEFFDLNIIWYKKNNY